MKRERPVYKVANAGLQICKAPVNNTPAKAKTVKKTGRDLRSK